MTNLIGQRLGQYEIISLLGEGGMATVYRARQESVDRDVAVKVIRSALVESQSFIDRFKREAKTVASLSHPHILKVFDYGQHEDIVYLVMEQMTGGSLTDLIQKGPLSMSMTTRMVEQIAGALDYAHRRGIIHRDLKPQNVLLDEDQNAFLTDFGIAKLLDSAAGGLTQSGAVVGTPSYMSPEQWKGGVVDARADIYSLGVMLFEMLAGSVPFSADTPFGMMHKHVYELPPMVRSTKPDLPPYVDEVLETALAKEPDARYGSATALSDAFKSAVQGVSPSTGTGTFKPLPMSKLDESGIFYEDSSNSRRTTFIAIGIFALLLVIAGGAFLAITSSNNANATATAIVAAQNNTATADSFFATNAAHASETSVVQSSQTAVVVQALTATANVTPTLTPSLTPSPSPSPSPTVGETLTPTEDTSTSGVALQPTVVIDSGSKIAFLAKVNGRTQIALIAPDGTSFQPLTSSTTEAYVAPIAWSPDRQQIAYVVKSTNSQSIYVMSSDGTNANRYVTGSYPAWSPNGKKIAYIGTQRGKDDVFVMNADGQNQHSLTNVGVRPAFVDWAPDNKRIAFIAGGVWVVNAENTAPPVRLNIDSKATSAVWSPDGTQLAITSGNSIYVINDDGSNQTPIATAGISPDWSPDGQEIMFTTNASNGIITIVGSDGSNSQTLTPPGSEPKWSPNGKEITYTSNGAVYVMDDAGNNPTKLGDGSSPVWAP